VIRPEQPERDVSLKLMVRGAILLERL